MGCIAVKRRPQQPAMLPQNFVILATALLGTLQRAGMYEDAAARRPSYRQCV
jgi:hypothetical protein